MCSEMRFMNGARRKKSVLCAGFAAAFLIVCGVCAQTKNVKPTQSVSTFKDSRDGKTYKKITIGGQRWMGENLNYVAEGSKCYENNAGNCENYGRLYNWSTAKTVCPAGWHLPSDDEWNTLTSLVGSSAGTKFKSKSGWNNNGNGTENYGFSALPGGYGKSDGFFGNVGYYGLWWSATENGAHYAWYRSMFYDIEIVYRNYNDKAYLFSVRCVQD